MHAPAARGPGPTLLLGKGTEAVGDLGASAVTDGLRLANRTVHQAGDDLLIAGDLERPQPAAPLAEA